MFSRLCVIPASAVKNKGAITTRGGARPLSQATWSATFFMSNQAYLWSALKNRRSWAKCSAMAAAGEQQELKCGREQGEKIESESCYCLRGCLFIGRLPRLVSAHLEALSQKQASLSADLPQRGLERVEGTEHNGAVPLSRCHIITEPNASLQLLIWKQCSCCAGLYRGFSLKCFKISE